MLLVSAGIAGVSRPPLLIPKKFTSGTTMPLHKHLKTFLGIPALKGEVYCLFYHVGRSVLGCVSFVNCPALMDGDFRFLYFAKVF